MKVDSTKFGNEAHFMSFAAIIATRKGTEGSNFHIRNTMTAIVEVSGNRLVCIVACDRATQCSPNLVLKHLPDGATSRFGEHRRSVTSNDANQPVAKHFNNGSHCVSDMKIRALCPFSGSSDSHKRHEMRLSKLGTVHPHGINERFSYI